MFEKRRVSSLSFSMNARSSCVSSSPASLSLPSSLLSTSSSMSPLAAGGAGAVDDGRGAVALAKASGGSRRMPATRVHSVLSAAHATRSFGCPWSTETACTTAICAWRRRDVSAAAVGADSASDE